jgi:hypothetical protein
VTAPSRLALLALAVTAVLGCGGCAQKRAPPDAGPDLAPKFALPGKCFGKPSKCRHPIDCGPPFNTCQEGTCCSGTLDPETCTCRCGDGGPCPASELCCPGAENVLKCRSPRECQEPLEE